MERMHGGSSGGEKRAHIPRLIAWEVTRSCNLSCVHCRASAAYGPYPDELTTEEAFRFLDDVADFAKPIIILTGGEPLMRADVFDIASYGMGLGLRMAMAPNGTLITPENARQMISSGIRRISISLDGVTPESHDAFRGVPGAFEGALQGIEHAKAAGLEFQINTTITRHNVGELEEMAGLAVELGAVAWHPFLLVPTGRGEELEGQELSPAEYERILNWFYDVQKSMSLHVKPTCAPHYYRVLRQRARTEGIRVTRETHGMEAMTKGCLGGQAFAFVSHVGTVQICGYLDVPCGDIRRQPFEEIWRTSPVFHQVRDLDGYGGRCGHCEYRSVCGGCRARAFARTGDYLAEEPYCAYTPKREASRAG